MVWDSRKIRDCNIIYFIYFTGMYFIVIAIGGRQDTNYNELSGIASRPVEENIYQIERISQLETLQLDTIQSICNG